MHSCFFGISCMRMSERRVWLYTVDMESQVRAMVGYFLCNRVKKFVRNFYNTWFYEEFVMTELILCKFEHVNDFFICVVPTLGMYGSMLKSIFAYAEKKFHCSFILVVCMFIPLLLFHMYVCVNELMSQELELWWWIVMMWWWLYMPWVFCLPCFASTVVYVAMYVYVIHCHGDSNLIPLCWFS